MSGSNRRDRGALVALGLILLAVVLVAGITALTYPSSAKKAARGQDDVEQNTQGNVHPGVAGPDGFNPWADPVDQWFMAVTSAVAAGISIVALIWVRGAWHEAKRTADAAFQAIEVAKDANKLAREMSESQVRAYVSLHNVRGSINADPTKLIVHIQAEMFNAGTTPARDISYKANLVRIGNLGERVIAHNSRTYDEPEDLLPGDKRCIFNDTLVLTEDEFIRMYRGGPPPLSFEGGVYYKTVFGHGPFRHWTRFAYTVRWLNWENTTSLAFIRAKDGNHAN